MTSSQIGQYKGSVCSSTQLLPLSSIGAWLTLLWAVWHVVFRPECLGIISDKILTTIPLPIYFLFLANKGFKSLVLFQEVESESLQYVSWMDTVN